MTSAGSLTSFKESFLGQIVDHQVEDNYNGRLRHVYQTGTRTGHNDFTELGKVKTKRSYGYTGLGCRGMFHTVIYLIFKILIALLIENQK